MDQGVFLCFFFENRIRQNSFFICVYPCLSVAFPFFFPRRERLPHTKEIVDHVAHVFIRWSNFCNGTDRHGHRRDP